MKPRVTWKRHLAEYRSDKGYKIMSPQRGTQYSLVLPNGRVHARYSKLYLAKEGAEMLERQAVREALGVARNGHEIFDSIWGAFDVTVANSLVEQSSEDNVINVEGFAQFLQVVKQTTSTRTTLTMGIRVNEEHVPTVDLTRPVTVAIIKSRSGGMTPMVIDGWHRIAKAHREGVAELPCRVLSEEDSLLVML